MEFQTRTRSTELLRTDERNVNFTLAAFSLPPSLSLIYEGNCRIFVGMRRHDILLEM